MTSVTTNINILYLKEDFCRCYFILYDMLLSQRKALGCSHSIKHFAVLLQYIYTAFQTCNVLIFDQIGFF
jgi:hypothetical protein